MRTLNLNELDQKINSYASDINYSDRVYVQEKVSQFFNFLHEQSISKRILERINEDFSFIKSEFPPSGHGDSRYRTIPNHTVIKTIKDKIKSREDQGAFGYFIIQQLYEVEQKFENHYFDAPPIWYRESNGDYNKRLDCFKEKFFKPFIELLEWYIYESEIRKDNDYFSKIEIENINSKLNEILLKQELGNEIIFNEIDELKELILFLNKKNWGQIVKGKLGDLVLGQLLSSENATSLYKYISENSPLFLK